MPQNLLFLVDVEPDAFHPLPASDAQGGWRGTRIAIDSLQWLREQFFIATGREARFNWFFRFDPQIELCWGDPSWCVRLFPELVEYVVNGRDYAGIHPHLYRWQPKERVWVDQLDDPGWASTCLGQSIDVYKSVFVDSPQACRFGKRLMSESLIHEMCSAGIRYDLTSEPGISSHPLVGDPCSLAPILVNMSTHPIGLVGTEGYQPCTLWVVPLSTATQWRIQHKFPFYWRRTMSPNLVWPYFPKLWRNARVITNRVQAPMVIVLRSGDLANDQYCRAFERNLRFLAKPDIAESLNLAVVSTAMQQYYHTAERLVPKR